jgi:YHS domain-containing protein
MTEIPSSNAQAQLAKTACGGKLKDTAGYPSAVYRGELVFFCTRACLVGFEHDPDRFMAGEIEHPIHDS